MQEELRPLVLIGAGHMGAALLSGWLDKKATSRPIYVVEPRPSLQVQALANHDQVTLIDDISKLNSLAGLLVVAIKPQVIENVLSLCRPVLDENSCLISIAAGVSLAMLEAGIGSVCDCARIMPNTPAQIGQAMSVGVSHVPLLKHKVEITRLFEAVGLMVWLEDEALIHVVTALSGSGPAYVFYLVEALAKAGVTFGLSEAMAMLLARQTVVGAGALLAKSSDPAYVLRRNVTSPQGTTEAGLAQFMRDNNGLQAIVDDVIQAAMERSKQLAGS